MLKVTSKKQNSIVDICELNLKLMPTVDVIFLSAEIIVGYVETSVTVFENDGVATLTVAISVPPGADPIETSFYLLVNTMDGSATAAGLSQSMEFVCVRYIQLPKLPTFVHCFLPFLATFCIHITATFVQMLPFLAII